ncbi:hypothetical protein [Rhizobium sp. L1K21]|uniref:hypothetical protein n=1 Tax=Rhizobium sp. L1K21 TaxID=2954933 RepID=UPI0020932220|nr:hypothetical protein [Rhizobium sp. L1K21]MCO6188577.1 hypothetical protein [Rhizobium sp. L1K21]
MNYKAGFALFTFSLLVPTLANAQSPCGQSEAIEPGESIEELSDRCNVSIPALLEANDAESETELRAHHRLSLPAASDSKDWLAEARRAVEDAGKRIGEAASEAGSSASDYLAENPDLNEDFIRLGENLGLPGFETGPARGAWLKARLDPDDRLHFQAAGLPGDAELELGWLENERFHPLETVRSNEQGRFIFTLDEPEAMPSGEEVTFVVRTVDDRLRLASDPIRQP